MFVAEATDAVGLKLDAVASAELARRLLPDLYSFTRQGGLSDAEAVELGAALVAAASRVEL